MSYQICYPKCCDKHLSIDISNEPCPICLGEKYAKESLKKNRDEKKECV